MTPKRKRISKPHTFKRIISFVLTRTNNTTYNEPALCHFTYTSPVWPNAFFLTTLPFSHFVFTGRPSVVLVYIPDLSTPKKNITENRESLPDEKSTWKSRSSMRNDAIRLTFTGKPSGATFKWKTFSTFVLKQFQYILPNRPWSRNDICKQSHVEFHLWLTCGWKFF